MSLHDGYARVTPWELTFRTREQAEALSAAVAEEAAALGVDDREAGVFLSLDAVGAFVRELEGPDGPAGSRHSFGALAFHGVQFLRAGHPTYLLSTHVARYLVDGSPEGGPSPPASSGYLQLPQHLFWADGGTGVPESVDGLFWSVTASAVIHTLIVTGIRPDRPGFGVIPLPEAPLSDAVAWMEAEAREDGPDFSTTLPGGELDGLYAFMSAGEALKLLARFFAYVGSVPDSVRRHDGEARDPGREASGSGEEGPQRSRLSYSRVVLDA